ncbi:hypothetical protein [Phocaeicola plebeius]|uniref:hypothetical protein n=1 Tax=Phocaeicola plebeius TaxID=310297 RepID=UPI0026F0187E|nr:hypothetical protein [Phocaeicola plebeius]
MNRFYVSWSSVYFPVICRKFNLIHTYVIVLVIVYVLADYLNKHINTFWNNHFTDADSIARCQSVKHIIYFFLELDEPYHIFTVYVQLGVIIQSIF